MTEVNITLEFSETYASADELAAAVYTYLQDLIEDGSLCFTAIEHSNN